MKMISHTGGAAESPLALSVSSRAYLQPGAPGWPGNRGPDGRKGQKGNFQCSCGRMSGAIMEIKVSLSSERRYYSCGRTSKIKRLQVAVQTLNVVK